MKKFVYPFLFIFFISYCFSKDYSHSEQYSKNVPLLLHGIWQGNDRLAFFSSDDSDADHFENVYIIFSPKVSL